MSKSIPDRWLDYKPYGNIIPGTKIVAFKVPLKEAVNKNLQPEQRFTTAILLKEFPKLKCIVDLTNTTKYYDQSEFTNAGVKYQKIMTPGKIVPPLEVVKRFFKTMENFTEECAEDEIIGVHCTHGINRSGYLICRYLVQQLGWENEQALKAIADARGYPVERPPYIISLKRTTSGAKLDVSKVDLDAPMPITKTSMKNYGNWRQSMKDQQHLFPPMGPPGPMPRGFMNGGPFAPPPVKFGPPRAPNFGPPRPPPPMVGPPPPHSPMFGRPRTPHGPYGPLPPPPPMRHGPPLPPLPPLPPPPGPMRIAGPPRLSPVMGPPGPLHRGPGMSHGGQRHGTLRIPPNAGIRISRRTNKVDPLKRPINRAAARSMANKQIKDQDFTADVFEENLAKPVRANHK